MSWVQIPASALIVKYSRLVSIEEKRNIRRAFIFGTLAIILLIVMIFLGIPTLAQIAAFLADLRGSSSPITISDTIPPAPPKFFSFAAATNSAKLILSGTAEAGTTISISQNGGVIGDVVSGEDGTFQKEVKLATGQNIFLAKAKDQAGNESQNSEALVILFDSEPPILEIFEPQDGASFSGEMQRRLTIKGKTEEGVTVTVNERLAIVDSQGNFSHQLTLEVGENSLKILAIDKAGNKTEKLLRVNFSL